jgi:hypothetical protein
MFTGVAPAEVTSVFLRFPQSLVIGQPLRVLVALHGMGGNGRTFASDLTAAVDGRLPASSWYSTYLAGSDGSFSQLSSINWSHRPA